MEVLYNCQHTSNTFSEYVVALAFYVSYHEYIPRSGATSFLGWESIVAASCLAHLIVSFVSYTQHIICIDGQFESFPLNVLPGIS